MTIVRWWTAFGKRWLAQGTGSAILCVLAWSTTVYGEIYFAHVRHGAAAGVRLGTPIYVLGRNVGKLTEMDYTEDGASVRMSLKIESKYSNKVVAASHVVLGTDSASGENYLELVRDIEPLGIEVAPDPRGISVKQVFPGTSAQRSGLLVDDVIHRINSQDIASISDWEVWRQTVEDGTSLKIEIFRGNKPGTVVSVADRRSGLAELPDGARLAFAFRGSNGGTTGAGRASVEEASAAVKSAADQFIPEIEGGIDQAMEMMTYLSEDLEKLMANANDLVEDDATRAMASLNTTLANLENLMNEVGPEASETVKEFNQVAKNLNAMLAQASSMLHVVEGELSYLPQINNMICQTSEMVDSVRNNPMVSRMVRSNHRRHARRCR